MTDGIISKRSATERLIIAKTLLESVLQDMPTAVPRKGKWTEVEICDGKVIEQWQSMKCDQCERYLTEPFMYYISKANFCPYCGADMREESDG